MEEIGIPGENHRPVERQSLSEICITLFCNYKCIAVLDIKGAKKGDFFHPIVKCSSFLDFEEPLQI
jgi:putative methionine-R-sulfoxide reductase with GAF domain